MWQPLKTLVNMNLIMSWVRICHYSSTDRPALEPQTPSYPMGGIMQNCQSMKLTTHLSLLLELNM
jgi:hypothetical protein